MSHQKAVIDRIVDDEHAVLLVGDEEAELVVPASQLPSDAREGAWLRVQMEDRELTDVIVDEEETEQSKQRIQSKLDQLRKRGRRL